MSLRKDAAILGWHRSAADYNGESDLVDDKEVVRQIPEQGVSKKNAAKMVAPQSSTTEQPSAAPAQSEARERDQMTALELLRVGDRLANPGSAPAVVTAVAYPGISESARIRLRALLWRASMELGQGHPARRHLDAIADDPPHSADCPAGHALATITATLRQMHAKEETLKHLSEAADILAGRR